jgi:glycosyltransferase involved in cell wall biosynthesis
MISIVISTKNEEKNLKNLLDSIKTQSFKDYEVIVVDNNSTDSTVSIANEYTDKVFNYGPERSAQRNFGALKSNGQFILVLDADMILENGLLREMFNFAIQNKDYKCLTMREEPIGKSFWAKCKKLELEFYTQPEDFELAPRWFEKKVFDEFRGFDELQTGTEDWDLPDRIYKKYPNKYLSYKRVFHNEGDYGLLRILKKKFYYASKSHSFVKNSDGGVINFRFLYFLRPQFYTHSRLWFKDLGISFGLLILLFLELLFGGIGFLIGFFKNINNQNPKTQ